MFQKPEGWFAQLCWQAVVKQIQEHGGSFTEEGKVVIKSWFPAILACMRILVFLSFEWV